MTLKYIFAAIFMCCYFILLSQYNRDQLIIVGSSDCLRERNDTIIELELGVKSFKSIEINNKTNNLELLYCDSSKKCYYDTGNLKLRVRYERLQDIRIPYPDKYGIPVSAFIELKIDGRSNYFYFFEVLHYYPLEQLNRNRQMNHIVDTNCNLPNLLVFASHGNPTCINIYTDDIYQRSILSECFYNLDLPRVDISKLRNGKYYLFIDGAINKGSVEKLTIDR